MSQDCRTKEGDGCLAALLALHPWLRSCSRVDLLFGAEVLTEAIAKSFRRAHRVAVQIWGERRTAVLCAAGRLVTWKLEGVRNRANNNTNLQRCDKATEPAAIRAQTCTIQDAAAMLLNWLSHE